MEKLTKEQRIEHIQKCEFHNGHKDGECPIISNKEAQKLREENNGRKNKQNNHS